MGDRLPVNCGVKLSGDKFVVTYRMGKDVEKNSIMWNWYEEGGKYIAKLEAKTKKGDIKYHNSAPVDQHIHSQLGKADGKPDGDYYTVKMKKGSPDVPDLGQFFDVPQ